jgi:hypothetical protein
MSDVVSFPVSQELIAKLVKAGYLEPGLCNDAVAVANAIARLKQDLRGGGDDGDPRLPNKLQVDLWAFTDHMPAARYLT